MLLRNKVGLLSALMVLAGALGCGNSSSVGVPPPGGAFGNNNLSGTYVFFFSVCSARFYRRQFTLRNKSCRTHPANFLELILADLFSANAGERFKGYAAHTFGIYSLIEAGARGGIDQAREAPSRWPEGGQGYADRFGSAMDQMAIRGTTEYLVSDLFREDLRFIPCTSPCSESKFMRALEDTFTARKGDDGHRALSVARFVGSIAGGTVATAIWYPSGYCKCEIVRQTAVSYAF